MRKILIPLVATILVSGVMVYQARTPETVLCSPPAVRLGEMAGYVSTAIETSEAERRTLPQDTIIEKRAYEASDGAVFVVTLVIGGQSKSSIHRPELCLPSQGFQMSSPRTQVRGGTPWRLLDLVRRDSAAVGFAYTFFNQAGFRTASHVQRILCDVWDRSILGRIDRWVMVTVQAPSPEDLLSSDFLAKLKGRVIP